MQPVTQLCNILLNFCPVVIIFLLGFVEFDFGGVDFPCEFVDLVQEFHVLVGEAVILYFLSLDSVVVFRGNAILVSQQVLVFGIQQRVFDILFIESLLEFLEFCVEVADAPVFVFVFICESFAGLFQFSDLRVQTHFHVFLLHTGLLQRLFCVL